MKPKYPASVVIMSLLMLIASILPGLVLMQRGDRFGVLYCLPGVILTVLGASVLAYFQRKQLRYIAKLSKNAEKTELAAFEKLPFGICVLDTEGTIVRFNPYFQQQVMGGAELFGRNLYEAIPFDTEAEEQDIFWQQRYYHVETLTYEEDGSALTAYVWTDVTELKELRLDYVNSRPCVLLFVVDNYEELIQNAKESVRLSASAAIERLLESFIAGTNGILRRLKNNRFLAVIEEQHVQEIISGKFKILDEARTIRIDEKNYVTLSVGVGQGASSLQESEAFAEQCLDMALGRGGDQAAVKTESGYRFFGGVSKGVEKKSRAKTRIVAGAIQELIMDSSHVFIMGHRFSDLDSIGGACGLAGAVRLMGVRVNVVVDQRRTLARQLLDLAEAEIGRDLFLSPPQALEAMTGDALLIIVDTHNKDILESPQLYEEAKRVVVIDHHRKTVNFVNNAIVFHHEPYASSACEMITELLQYFKLPEAVDSIYADCLLSGIMLDTKNFVMRTGVRTFEAAAYLRKIGADTVRVKGLFSGSIEAYRSRTELVSSAQLQDGYAIAEAPPNTPEVRVVAPQAADELLGISGVQASFVIYEVNHVVNISARSYGMVNVQVIMEQLGGGGHQSMAAAQIPDISTKEARQRLLAVLEAPAT